MDVRRIRRGSPRALALAAIACALLLRLIVPQGWMPAETAGGWRITLCSGAGPMQMDMAVPMAAAMKGMHHAPSQQDHETNDHPCAFSSLAMALDEPLPLSLDLPAPIIGRWLVGIGTAVTIGRGLVAPPPPSTGPPHA